MFRGRHEHAIDAKGRTSLPSRFREALAATGDSRIVMTTDLLHPCVRVYPWQEWIKHEAAIAEESQFDELMATARRFAIAESADCDVDKLGRVLVPANLREYAGLERDVVWLGVGKCIELWDKRAWQQMRDRVLANRDELQAVVQRLAQLGMK